MPFHFLYSFTPVVSCMPHYFKNSAPDIRYVISAPLDVLSDLFPWDLSGKLNILMLLSLTLWIVTPNFGVHVYYLLFYYGFPVRNRTPSCLISQFEAFNLIICLYDASVPNFMCCLPALTLSSHKWGLSLDWKHSRLKAEAHFGGSHEESSNEPPWRWDWSGWGEVKASLMTSTAGWK